MFRMVSTTTRYLLEESPYADTLQVGISLGRMIKKTVVEEPRRVIIPIKRHLMPFGTTPQPEALKQRHDTACPCIRCKIPVQGLISPLVPPPAASAPVIPRLGKMPTFDSSPKSEDNKEVKKVRGHSISSYLRTAYQPRLQFNTTGYPTFRS